MIIIQQLKLPVTHTKEDLQKKVLKQLSISKEQLLSCRIAKQSIDARKKNDVHYVYSIEVETPLEQMVISHTRHKNIQLGQRKEYIFPAGGTDRLFRRPVIIGSGPAGLFCAHALAAAGYAPRVIERGKTVDKRTKDVSDFWMGGPLLPNSNVQFGEGGAGTFSDGKLNTLVKDVAGRNREVLDTFIRYGAPEEIRYEAKPHIGTDILANVIPNMRKGIEAMGGSFLFESCVTDIRLHGGRIQAVCINNKEWMDTDVVILAIGHSARDTFYMLDAHALSMEAKSFAVGLRVEHPQEMISSVQYGTEAAAKLPPASYKLTANLPNGRGVYSFCMCPGGYVVNASSEEGMLSVNGMSDYKRDSKNANSAIIVSVTPADFKDDGPLSGISFQRELEEKAYSLGKGKIPQQLYGDFKAQKNSTSYGRFASCCKGNSDFGELHRLFPKEVYESFVNGMEDFSKHFPGFSREDAILSGVESRTSSPVRIHRNEKLESNYKGIYPCGEGAGYAGGIMSAAMDGLKIAEAIAAKYAPIENRKEAPKKTNTRNGR